jgi:hypothetical protein
MRGPQIQIVLVTGLNYDQMDDAAKDQMVQGRK